jgi:transposase-like protein/IS1 family transposase
MIIGKKIQQMTVSQWEKAFPTEEACRDYLTIHRWPSAAVKCPRCGNDRVHYLAKAHTWSCKGCAPDGYHFSVLTGTIFENTNKPLRDWFRVIHRMLTSKKGVSALQIYREMGFGSYRTAWYMCHRVRVGLANEDFRKLMGVVEVDETFIGGDDSNRHIGKKKGSKGKSIVIGAAERKGKVVARVLDRADHYGMEQFVRMVCGDKVSLLATDEHKAYGALAEDFNHGTVTHSKKQYVVGAIHTNTIEGFWSLFKRSIVGSYHKVSAKYLPLYIAEAQFRYNNRHNQDIFGTAIAGL